MSAFSYSRSNIYNFEMAKVVYVQVNGIEKPARIEADKVERKHEETKTRAFEKLVISKENVSVGEFNADLVVGWWIQNE